MKFGLSLSGLQRDKQGRDMGKRFGEILTYVHAARDLGFHHVSFGNHYLTHPYQMFQPEPLIARIIPDSGDLRLVTTVIATLRNPVALAEEFATLDVLSGGRVILTMALGYRDEEYRAFGVDPGRRVGRMEEVVTGVRALWTDGVWSRAGRHFDPGEVRISVTPAQRPHPPIWIAANADKAVSRAARWGLPWRVNSHATHATIARQVALYRDAYQPQEGRDVLLPVSRELYCAVTRERAFTESAPHLRENYDRYANWGQDKALPGDEDFRIGYEELSQDRFVVGDPDDCTRELARYQALGAGYFTFRMNWPGMPLERSLESMRLIATEVMPRFADNAAPAR